MRKKHPIPTAPTCPNCGTPEKIYHYGQMKFWACPNRDKCGSQPVAYVEKRKSY